MGNCDKPSLFLASASPRRRALLAQLGFDVYVQAVDIDESRHHNEPALDYCVRLSLEKNQAAVRRFQPRLPVISADTIVVLGEETLGKPHNRKAVVSTLKKLSNTDHQVITAVAVYYQGQVLSDYQISQVHFADIDKDWMTDYAGSSEPYDKAGAYGIQGAAGRWIKSINGSYSGIMGLPLFETAQLLSNLNVMSNHHVKHAVHRDKQ